MDYAQMPAGREMDALVAEKVMELTVVATDWPCGPDPECGHYEASPFLPPSSWHGERGSVIATTRDGWPPKELPRHDPPFEIEPTHGAMVEPVPFYSADLAAAWLIVEKLRADWCGDVRISVSVEVETWACDIVALTGHGRLALMRADTAPLAICRAALKAAERFG